MELKSPFWSFLEELEDFSAPLIDWKNALGGKHDINRFRNCFLASTDRYAKAVKCFSPCDKPCPLKVVRTDENHVQAVCEDSRAKQQALDEFDILIYRLQEAKLHKILAETFGFKLAERDLHDKRRYYLGEYTPFAGIGYPVYMSYCNYIPSMSGMIKNLCAEHQGKFILLSTSRRFLTPETELLLKKQGAVFVSLEDELIIDRQCNVSLRHDISEVFAPLLKENSDSNPDFFPTPPGAKWEDVHIHFQDEQTVSIRIGNFEKAQSCVEMGMANSLNKQPMGKWKFLYELAEGHGIADWKNASDIDARKMRKKALCEALRKFFRIEGADSEGLWTANPKQNEQGFLFYVDSES